MKKQTIAAPFFDIESGPSNDLPIPPHRTQNLPQILASLTDDELAKWSGELADQERERRSLAVARSRVEQ